MAARGHDVRVVHGLPFALGRIGPRAWREIAASPRRELRCTVSITRPRYPHVPRLARVNARAFAARCAREILVDPRPAVVVADYAWPAAMAAGRLCRAGLPFVVHGRGSDVIQVCEEPRLRPLLARALHTAGHWCAVSADLVRRMDELGGRPGHGVLTPNGVDLDLFAPRERAGARAALGLPAGATVVLVVGHLIARKDPLLALQVFHAWAGSRSDALLVFVGRGALGTRVAAQAERLGLASRTRLVGELPPAELARWYAAADVLLLTSSREGRPNVVLEALASGLPVLATEAGGTAELLAGLPGALCTSRDPGSLAQALASLLATRPAPDALRARVAHLSWEAGLEALEHCLARAVEEGGRR